MIGRALPPGLALPRPSPRQYVSADQPALIAIRLFPQRAREVGDRLPSEARAFCAVSTAPAEVREGRVGTVALTGQDGSDSGSLAAATCRAGARLTPAPLERGSAHRAAPNQAQLQEDGTILTTFTYDCVPGFAFTEPSEGFLEVRVEQPEAFGATFAPATCDDQKHKVTLDIGPGPFKPGSAFAVARLTNSTEFVAEKQAEIQIK